MHPSCIDPSCNTIWKDQIHSGFSFQHVNDPKLTVSAVQEYLGKDRKINTVTVIDWPPQIPDFNIITAVRSSRQRSEEKAQQPKKILVIYSWRLSKDITKSYTKRVEAILNTDFQAQFVQFCLIYTAIYVCTFF